MSQAIEWRKSTRSGSENECVEVGVATSKQAR